MAAVSAAALQRTSEDAELKMATSSSSRTYPPHFDSNKQQITFGIITVSDQCFRKEKDDVSGPVLKDLIKNCQHFNGEVAFAQCVPDEIPDIKAALFSVCDALQLNVCITTGGTGFAPRDVTPEATKEVIEKEAPGLMIGMSVASLQHTVFGMLSRAVCGIRKRTIIINVPGKPSAVTEYFEAFSPVLDHAVKLLSPPTTTNDQIKNSEKKSKYSDLDDIEHARKHKNVPAAFLNVKPSLSHEHKFTPLLHKHELNFPLSGEAVDNISITSSVKTDNVAGRSRKSEYPIFKVDDALECILSHAQPIGTVQRSINNNSLEKTLGYILAEDICADEPHPPFPASIKDGYAIIASDGVGIRKVIDNSIAGSAPDKSSVKSGTCVRINTGAPIPQGANAVIQVEDTKLVSNSKGEETEIEILKESSVGQDIRAVGSDIRQGQVVVPAKSIIGAGELGAAATVGKVQFNVYAKPKISVLTTGNEIVEPSVVPKPGQIRDSNKVELLSFFKSKGFEVFDGKIASDHPDVILNHLITMFSISDVIIISGGMSMGEKDYIKEVLKQDLNVVIHFGRVFMKPGKPTAFGTTTYKSKKKLIFGLPGNPVSTLVTAQLFVLPALLSMSGHANTSPTIVKAKFDVTRKLDERPEYVRARLEWKDGGATPVVSYTTSHQISSNVCSLVGANALISLPPASSTQTKIDAGSIVDVVYTGHV